MWSSAWWVVFPRGLPALWERGCGRKWKMLLPQASGLTWVPRRQSGMETGRGQPLCFCTGCREALAQWLQGFWVIWHLAIQPSRARKVRPLGTNITRPLVEASGCEALLIRDIWVLFKESIWDFPGDFRDTEAAYFACSYITQVGEKQTEKWGILPLMWPCVHVLLCELWWNQYSYPKHVLQLVVPCLVTNDMKLNPSGILLYREHVHCKEAGKNHKTTLL